MTQLDMLLKKGVKTFRGIIAEMIKHPPEGSRVLIIIPEDAQWLLDTYNIGNRSKKPDKIKQFTKDMTEEAWSLTGDTLKFSNKGLLRDGQNRLYACVKSGVPLTTHIVFGVEDSSFDVMDRGTPRSGSDVLGIAGYKNTSNLAPAIRWVHLIENDIVKSRIMFEPKELLHMVKEWYPSLPDYILQARTIQRVTGLPSGLVAAVLYIAARADPKKSAEFAQALETGGRVPHGKPVVHLLNRLQELHKLTEGRTHEVVRAALLITAWNLFMHKRAGYQKDFKWSLTDEFPHMID